MKTFFAVLYVATLLGLTELAASHNQQERKNDLETVSKNVTQSSAVNKITFPILKDNYPGEPINGTSLPTVLSRSKRQTRRGRPRKLSRKRPPFLPPRLPPIARRRFPKRPPGKGKFHPKPPQHGLSPPNSAYGPPVGFFVMNINNEIVHKSKDLGDIPPQYLDKIIPPNFISDSPPKIYALEHDEGEQKDVPFGGGPTNSYGVPLHQQPLDPVKNYYSYTPIPSLETNNVPQSTETRPHITYNQINNYNRGQSETLHNQEQLPPIVYHPPYKKNKKKTQQPQLTLQPDAHKNTYHHPQQQPSSYDAPLNYAASHEREPTRYSSGPQAPHSPPANKQQHQWPPFNVGQSFVESYSRDSSDEQQEPPPLPAIYNQNDFKTAVNKSNNKKKVVYQVNTSYEDLDDENDHGLALEYPPSEEEHTEAPAFNFGVRNKKKKKPPKFDFIDSYEDSSISQEVYRTTPFTVTRPFKSKTPPQTTHSTTTRTLYRIRSTTKDPLFDILDTEELRNAFQSGRHRYKLAAYKKSKEPQNFVLLSSQNPFSSKAATKTPFIINTGSSGEDYKFSHSKEINGFDRPPSSRESAEYDSYEIAERNFGLRKRDFVRMRGGPKDKSSNRNNASGEKIEFSESQRKDEVIRPTTIKPRFNPDVHFTKTFSSKIEQPRESSIWNGQSIPGNHKITKRLSST